MTHDTPHHHTANEPPILLSPFTRIFNIDISYLSLPPFFVIIWI